MKPPFLPVLPKSLDFLFGFHFGLQKVCMLDYLSRTAEYLNKWLDCHRFLKVRLSSFNSELLHAIGKGKYAVLDLFRLRIWVLFMAQVKPPGYKVVIIIIIMPSLSALASYWKREVICLKLIPVVQFCHFCLNWCSVMWDHIHAWKKCFKWDVCMFPCRACDYTETYVFSFQCRRGVGQAPCSVWFQI